MYRFIEYSKTFFFSDRISQVFYINFNVNDLPTYIDSVKRQYS